MKMGEYIASLRRKRGWSQEELGQRLVPPVNSPAINKWENGKTENIKRTYIEQMAKLFSVHPVDLMCFDFDVVGYAKKIDSSVGQLTFSDIDSNIYDNFETVGNVKRTNSGALVLELDKNKLGYMHRLEFPNENEFTDLLYTIDDLYKQASAEKQEQMVQFLSVYIGTLKNN